VEEKTRRKKGDGQPLHLWVPHCSISCSFVISVSSVPHLKRLAEDGCMQTLFSIH
jgi:hypothetical protein